MVTDVKIVDRVEDEALFRVTWADEVDGILETIRNHDSVVLTGEGLGDHWTFQLRFPEHEDLSSFYRATRDKGIPLELNGIHNPVERSDSVTAELTDEQFQALGLYFL